MSTFRAFTCALSALAASAAPVRAQCETARFRGSDTVAADRFGHSVDVSGERVIVGAPHDNDLGYHSGSAYVFVRTPAGWEEEAKLLPADGEASDRFGFDVAIDGTRAVVGAPWHNHPQPQGGAVYVFERQPGGWVETAKLEGVGFAARMGHAVDVEGARVLGGAPYDNGAGNAAGAVQVFEESAGSWSHSATLIPAQVAAGDLFGRSVALSGDRLVAGATGHDQPVLIAGAAWVFERTPGGWVERAKLSADPPQPGTEFGQSVALDGARALVGASFVDEPLEDTGTVYVFEEQGSDWSQTGKLRAADAAYNMHFGASVALAGDAALVGSSLAPASGLGSGAGYWFRFDGNEWSQEARLVSLGANGLGGSVALDGETGILSENGRARTFALPAFADPYCHCSAMVAPCANRDASGGCAHSGGYGSLLGACGSASVAADDLLLSASFLPGSSVALLFAGDQRVNGGQGAAFGDGLLCVGGSIRRLGTISASQAGSAQWGPGLGALGQWAPGDVRDLQVWFRDPSGPCGSGFGLSNAVEVTLAP